MACPQEVQALCGDDMGEGQGETHPSTSYNRSSINNLDISPEGNGANTIPLGCSSSGRVRLVLGGQCINWPCPDQQLNMKFWDEESLWTLPEAIQDGLIRVAGFEQIIVATAPPVKWGKLHVKDWVYKLVTVIRNITPSSVVKILTCLPRQDDKKMMFINFNRNLSAAIHATVKQTRQSGYICPVAQICTKRA